MIRYLFLCLICIIAPLFATQAQFNREPDTVNTEKGELIIHPVLHGTVVFEWNELTVYMDPWGQADLYDELPAPDLILITHPHGDHLSPETLSGLDTQNSSFFVPRSVADGMPEIYLGQTTVLANGENFEFMGINIKAVPMYNLPEEGARHPKGWGNGYVLTVGGKDIYISGDTEGIPEMRNLEGIDIAFVCMNLPYTMDVKQAADAVLDFRPAIIYPYHHRGQDINEFKKLVNSSNNDIKVRLKNWYPG